MASCLIAMTLQQFSPQILWKIRHHISNLKNSVLPRDIDAPFGNHLCLLWRLAWFFWKIAKYLRIVYLTSLFSSHKSQYGGALVWYYVIVKGGRFSNKPKSCVWEVLPCELRVKNSNWTFTSFFTDFGWYSTLEFPIPYTIMSMVTQNPWF